MSRRKFSRRHRTIIRVEAYTTGAIDFNAYWKNKDKYTWKIKHDLVLEHTSRKVLLDSLMLAMHLSPDNRIKAIEHFSGVDLKDVEDSQSDNNEVLTPDKFMKMSGEQMMDVYNSIIKAYSQSRSSK